MAATPPDAPPASSPARPPPYRPGVAARLGRGLAIAAAALALGTLALVLSRPELVRAMLPWGPWAAGPPAYHEVVHDVARPLFGRDLVIAPADATPDRIAWLVADVADADSSPVLRINVFTSATAARRRRDLLAAGIFAKDENDTDSPEWHEVNVAWVGVYTRDPADGVHQLAVCLDDPAHDHCAVERYPFARS
jgi:hypothetical protein